VAAEQRKPSDDDTYASEADLVASFIEHLPGHPRWSDMKVGLEFFYARGRTDVVMLAAGGEIVAVEAKLRRWREALQQAYRNRCFAHRTFVVLPASTAYLALRYEFEFRRRGVGLLVVSDDGIVEAFDSDARDRSKRGCPSWRSKQLAKGGVHGRATPAIRGRRPRGLHRARSLLR
jgi:hypothetical protein